MKPPQITGTTELNGKGKAVRSISKAVAAVGNEHLIALLYAQRLLHVRGTCWLWGGYRTKDGYGLLFVDFRGTKFVLLVHALAYRLWKGAVPKGMGLCHDAVICRSRACFNPSHTRPCTRVQNERDKQLKSQQFGKRTI
jgi:hypothetical protein